MKAKQECPGLVYVVVFSDSISEDEKRSAQEAGLALFTMKELEVCNQQLLIISFMFFFSLLIAFLNELIVGL